MKLKNKSTGKIVNVDFIYPETAEYFCPEYKLKDFIKEWEDYKPKEPLIKDEKVRKAVRAWADVLEIDEAEFYGNNTWIGLRTTNSRTGWSSKFELDYYGSENTLVPFRVYTIAELCGEEEG